MSLRRKFQIFIEGFHDLHFIVNWWRWESQHRSGPFFFPGDAIVSTVEYRGACLPLAGYPPTAKDLVRPPFAFSGTADS
jgi:hypothetical protein